MRFIIQFLDSKGRVTSNYHISKSRGDQAQLLGSQYPMSIRGVYIYVGGSRNTWPRLKGHDFLVFVMTKSRVGACVTCDCLPEAFVD